MDPGRLLPIHPASEMRSVFTFFRAGNTGANSPALIVHGPKKNATPPALRRILSSIEGPERWNSRDFLRERLVRSPSKEPSPSTRSSQLQTTHADHSKCLELCSRDAMSPARSFTTRPIFLLSDNFFKAEAWSDNNHKSDPKIPSYQHRKLSGGPLQALDLACDPTVHPSSGDHRTNNSCFRPHTES